MGRLSAAKGAVVQAMAHLCLAKVCDRFSPVTHLDRQSPLAAGIQGEDGWNARAGLYPALDFLLPDCVICHALNGLNFTSGAFRHA